MPVLALVALLAPASSLAVSPLHSISVYGEGEDVVAVFSKAKCLHKKHGSETYFNATAISEDGRDKLYVSIGEFAGFKREYEIEPGTVTPRPFVAFQEDLGDGSTMNYASYYPPPAEIPTIGRVLFREGGRLLGVGYGPAMYDYHGTHAVNFTGVLECEYPGKKGKGGKKGKPGK